MTTPIYKVKSGESLSKIATTMLGDTERWKELAFINGIGHPYIIYPGQILELPDENKPPLVIEVFGKPPEKTTAAPVTRAGFSISPATVIVLAIGAVFFLSKK